MVVLVVEKWEESADKRDEATVTLAAGTKAG